MKLTITWEAENIRATYDSPPTEEGDDPTWEVGPLEDDVEPSTRIMDAIRRDLRFFFGVEFREVEFDAQAPAADILKAKAEKIADVWPGATWEIEYEPGEDPAKLPERIY